MKCYFLSIFIKYWKKLATCIFRILEKGLLKWALYLNTLKRSKSEMKHRFFVFFFFYLSTEVTDVSVVFGAGAVDVSPKRAH